MITGKDVQDSVSDRPLVLGINNYMPVLTRMFMKYAEYKVSINKLGSIRGGANKHSFGLFPCSYFTPASYYFSISISLVCGPVSQSCVL